MTIEESIQFVHDRSRPRSAGDVLGELRLSSPPVDVLAVAEAQGIRVKATHGAHWDGAIDMGGNGEPPTIYVDAAASPSRIRFTIAHELGHYFLHAHRQQAFRDRFSAQGLDPFEIEANRFAADLLMPANWVRAYARYEDAGLLATRFDVSEEAMRYRLKNLRIG